MTDLPATIADEIDRLSEVGNVSMEAGLPRDAIDVWNRAVSLLPEPKTEWEAALWLYTSLGDAYRKTGDLQSAKHVLYNAVSSPDGHMNPLTLLWLGETLVDLGETKAGIEHLLRAYMLDGADVFAESPRALELLKQENLVS